MNVLVVNAGSSSLKLRLLGPDDAVLAAVDLGARAGRPDPDEVRTALGDLTRLGALRAVGHRIVHGGTAFVDPVVVTDRVTTELTALTALAPLHQPAALAALAQVRAAVPDVVQVACFDTAFHARMPPAATTYAVPAHWRDHLGVRRYGFHGLSHAYAARRAVALTGGRRVVTAHLGSGASLAAVCDGVGIDTTMGFTPLEGLVMSTRSGTVDPGLLLWLQTSVGMSADDLTDALFHRSGLFALAGTADMRAVVDRAAAGEPDGSLALAVYLHRLRAQIAAMAAALGGLDTLVFTGGVGERSPVVRAGAVAGLGFLGVAVDPARNEAHTGPDSASPDSASPDSDVTAAGSSVRTLIVEAREDLEIARGVRACLATGQR
ncbi:acetate/propionate family kinase [Frankia sp. Cas3]|uniref:acetate/propionate family kinase n=1 Tax=Frankia sp. Cas3 TaxID=3073926 RepID=UPI003A0FBBC6